MHRLLTSLVEIPTGSQGVPGALLYVTQYGSTVYIGMALVWPVLN